MSLSEAHAELSRQIEALEPSAVRLEVHGFEWETAATLAKFIESGEPDIAALKEHGITLETAIGICRAISQRHARKAAAVAAVAALKPTPKPAPLPALPYSEPLPAKPDVMDSMSALSALHTFCEMATSNQSGCITVLMNDGWSESTAREMVKVINASLAIQRRVA